MWQSPQDTYLEERVLSAAPLELVHMLYQACARSVREARSHLAAGEIAPRARAITKAQQILTELTGSLDPNGGEISQRLAQLYDYMQRRFLEANLQQKDEPLAEVGGLLATLSEAWESLATRPSEAAMAAAWSATEDRSPTYQPEPPSQPESWAPSPSRNPWAPPPETVNEYAPASWSF